MWLFKWFATERSTWLVIAQHRSYEEKWINMRAPILFPDLKSMPFANRNWIKQFRPSAISPCSQDAIPAQRPLWWNPSLSRIIDIQYVCLAISAKACLFRLPSARGVVQRDQLFARVLIWSIASKIPISANGPGICNYLGYPRLLRQGLGGNQLCRAERTGSFVEGPFAVGFKEEGGCLDHVL